MSQNGPAVVVLLEVSEGALRSPSTELLTLARELSDDVTAVSLGEVTDDIVNEAAGYGADRVMTADVGSSAALSPVAAEALEAAVRHVSGSIVLLTSSFPAREVAALLARALEAGLVVDAVPEGLVDGRLRTSKRVLAGTWDVVSDVRTPAAVLTVQPNAVRPVLLPKPRTATVEQLTVDPSPAATAVQIVERTVHPASGEARPALAEAAVVVAGGRGTLGDFSPIAELADALGAAVGATRDAVDEGWIDHDAQIGQTGVTVTPRVYVGAGISGAPHHRGGMQASGAIVTVNTDGEVPLAEISDLVIVGDLAEVLPQAAAVLREYRGQEAR